MQNMDSTVCANDKSNSLQRKDQEKYQVFALSIQNSLLTFGQFEFFKIEN